MYSIKSWLGKYVVGLKMHEYVGILQNIRLSVSVLLKKVIVWKLVKQFFSRD